MTVSFLDNAVLVAGDGALNAIYHELCEPTTIERRVYLSFPVHRVILSAPSTFPSSGSLIENNAS